MSSARPSPISLVFVGVIAAVGGAASTWFMQNEAMQDPPPKVARSSERRSTEPQRDGSGRVEDLDVRLRRMERRLESEESRLHGAGEVVQEVSIGQDQGVAEVERAVDLEAELAAEEEIWQSRDDAFEAEIVDPVWAAQMKTAITDQYSSFLGTGELRSLDCRATMCRATIQWPSEQAMRHGSRNALHGTTEIAKRCVRHVRQTREDNIATLVVECPRETG